MAVATLYIEGALAMAAVLIVLQGGQFMGIIVCAVIAC